MPPPWTSFHMSFRKQSQARTRRRRRRARSAGQASRATTSVHFSTAPGLRLRRPQLLAGSGSLGRTRFMATRRPKGASSTPSSSRAPRPRRCPSEPSQRRRHWTRWRCRLPLFWRARASSCRCWCPPCRCCLQGTPSSASSRQRGSISPTAATPWAPGASSLPGATSIRYSRTCRRSASCRCRARRRSGSRPCRCRARATPRRQASPAWPARSRGRCTSTQATKRSACWSAQACCCSGCSAAARRCPRPASSGASRRRQAIRARPELLLQSGQQGRRRLASFPF
mmetsp:Transcript_67537/g.206841  ORF Transcript_67537/g.206841 Transcript_67537/m.206841 type:complete len:284 (+) Transcript_67537:95-946(+)